MSMFNASESKNAIVEHKIDFSIHLLFDERFFVTQMFLEINFATRSVTKTALKVIIV